MILKCNFTLEKAKKVDILSFLTPHKNQKKNESFVR